jgi:hypothetical protein
MNYSITQNGISLDKSLYTIDEATKTFSTNESYLVLDFSGEFGWTFKTGWDCTFNTEWNCTFNTGSHCTFDTSSECTFNTGSHCTFDTSSECTFDTGEGCVLVYRYEKTYFHHLTENITSIILDDGSLVELKDKNAALLNIKHDEEIVRECCKKILKGEN